MTGYIQYCKKKQNGTDTKAMGQTEPQFLSDPMSDRKKKFSPTLPTDNKQNVTLLVFFNVQIIFVNMLINYNATHNLIYFSL